MKKIPYKTVLTIAGSDSSGGAGIQADIKTISANGAYSASVITASTAQNTQGVRDIHPIPIPHIVQQLEAVLEDIEFGAVKIGMLHSSEVVEVVKETLAKYRVKNIILDPVMISTSGNSLLNQNAIESLKAFLPSVLVMTPNIPEAKLLLGKDIELKNVKESAKALGEKYKTSVLLKGGHLEFTEIMTDTLYNYQTKELTTIQNRAVQTVNTHGTGCTLSSAIATFICLGESLEGATIKGCAYLNQALVDGKDKYLGKGHGAVNHFGI